MKTIEIDLYNLSFVLKSIINKDWLDIEEKDINKALSFYKKVKNVDFIEIQENKKTIKTL